MSGDVTPSRAECRRERLIVMGVMILYLSVALFTERVWEDFYIIYRHSRNACLGYGLVYSPGERVHGFTSPLGALLPAFLCKVSFDSTAIVIWLYRFICSVAMGVAVVVAMRLCRRLQLTPASILFGATFLAIDAKLLDFGTNGMETSFVVLFLLLYLYLLLNIGSGRMVALGATMAGLMWARPDSCIYILIAFIALLLFPPTAQYKVSRSTICKNFIGAGCIGALLYCPWFLFAIWYYGSPVPHTIIAKAGFSWGYSLMRILGTIFSPTYISYGKITFYSEFLSLSILTALLMPGMSAATRRYSLSFLLAAIYLYSLGTPYPWYFSSATVFAALALSCITTDLTRMFGAKSSTLFSSGFERVALGIVVFHFTLSCAFLPTMRIQQQEIENHGRRLIGLWLKEHAAPNDTLFLECVGYVGYFSGLKAYDFPGLTSPEVVKARREVGNNYSAVIDTLSPTWLVLRPSEVRQINSEQHELLASRYEPVQTFSANERLAAHPHVPWIYYPMHDSTFLIFRLRSGSGHVPTGT